VHPEKQQSPGGDCTLGAKTIGLAGVWRNPALLGDPQNFQTTGCVNKVGLGLLRGCKV